MKTKKFKSRLLLEEGATYLSDIDYLTLRSTWYVKKISIKLINLNSGRISLTKIVTNINFGMQ